MSDLPRAPIGAAPRDLHPREARGAEWETPHPLYVVWEITLACDLGCRHCGSRAGPRRDGELTTAECLDVVRQFAEMGIREVTLIGGEAYLRDDWDVIARAITDAGMVVGMTTGARNLDDDRLQRAVDAGMRSISISLDGLERTHDAQRGVKGSWRAAVNAAERIAKTPILLANNTQINRLSLPELPALASLLGELGTKAWQIQLTVPMGHGADKPDLLLQPFELLQLYPLLVWIRENRLDPAGVRLYPGNNIGYFGPYEAALRYRGERGAHWAGCAAGKWCLGMEADGKIKGCPSLPSDTYTGGMTREVPIAEAVANATEIAHIRTRTRDDLWGFCRSCYYADVCKAGCTWTSHVFMGRPGNNPYCIHRALEHEAQGLRERLVQVEEAPGRPFDNGRFDIVVEPFPTATAPDAVAAPNILGFDPAQVLALGPHDGSIWTDDAIASILGGGRRRTPFRTRAIPAP
jgi:radical SAM protein with 4Fe4S-binding SPASM domain